MLPRWLPDALSVARVPASLGVVTLYESRIGVRFWIAVGLIILIIASDVVDGWVARHQKTQSTLGYLLDGWGDRAFHVAIYLILLEQGSLPVVIVWMLLFREVSIYAVRAIDPAWQSTQSRFERTVNVFHTALVRVIVVTDIARVVVLWLSILEFRLATPVLLCLSATVSYVFIGKRLVQAWRRTVNG